MPSSLPHNHGQVIEYIQDRLYLGSYTYPPNEFTPFPYPEAPSSRSPHKRSSKSQSAAPVQASSGPKKSPPAYFSIDDTLIYNRFHADFGPLHIGHLYRFAVQLHNVLGDKANEDRGIVFWSNADPRSRANAACLLACYMVMFQSWPPHLALAPIAQADPAYMPFRDAGYSQADYGLTVQDVVYGVWKAKEEGMCSYKGFDLEEYETYERVDMGDFNWVTPSFLAFASPQHKPVAPIPTSSPLYAALPTNAQQIASAMLPLPFKHVLHHFQSRNIGLVVRLNSELYSPSYFTALGITHLDMIFDDGTCPPLSLVRQFINLAHEMIHVHKRGIAVHCKAGLGRTGCLIGAYLIYAHAFTANEVIAFMRFMRPGMVVGPQQHWLHLNQTKFREWWCEDSMREKILASIVAKQPSTPTKATSPQKRSHRTASASHLATPPPHARSALGEIDSNEASNVGAASTNGHSSSTTAMEECLPAPTPGQPRKTSRMNSPHRGTGAPYSTAARSARPSSRTTQRDHSAPPPPAKETVSMTSQRTSTSAVPADDDAEWRVQRTTRVERSATRSPGAGGADGGRRALSYSSTTVTQTTETRVMGKDADAETRGIGEAPHVEPECALEQLGSDVENWTVKGNGSSPQSKTGDGEGGEKGFAGSGGRRVRTPRGCGLGQAKGRAVSGSGSGGGLGMKVRAEAGKREGGSARGIRKISGRVGSVGSGLDGGVGRVK